MRTGRTRFCSRNSFRVRLTYINKCFKATVPVVNSVKEHTYTHIYIYIFFFCPPRSQKIVSLRDLFSRTRRMRHKIITNTR